jgi:hypothetical protein
LGRAGRKGPLERAVGNKILSGPQIPLGALGARGWKCSKAVSQKLNHTKFDQIFRKISTSTLLDRHIEKIYFMENILI